MPDSPTPSRRRPGGQPGNTNAVRHGYYSRFFRGSEQSDLANSALPTGIIDEIALLRTLLRRVAEYSSQAGDLQENLVVLKIVSQASAALGHLLRVQKLLEGSSQAFEQQGLAEAIARARQKFFAPGADIFDPQYNKKPPSSSV